jgi:hypothetical protein
LPMARIAAFKPGLSPPAVNIPICLLIIFPNRGVYLDERCLFSGAIMPAAGVSFNVIMDGEKTIVFLAAEVLTGFRGLAGSQRQFH